MHEYGTTADDLAAIAVVIPTNAARHPGAHMRDPLTIADVKASRTIASPLGLLDCSLISDGAAAVIVSAADAAPSVRVEGGGAGQRHTHEHIIAAAWLTETGCAVSSRTALEKAGVSVGQIDIAQIYDSFTITLLVELESIGFFPKGAGGRLRSPLAHSTSSAACPAIPTAACYRTAILARPAACLPSSRR